ncbi:MAG: PEP-CTERM sorting domain-containing protein [Victivallales bacterium]|nr:PEP-CTERM sorting domain-containing protein [Victivallales bacterium]
MKKLMIMLAAIAAAVVCNAASVKWASGAVYKTDGTTKVGKGATDYLVTINFFSDAAGSEAVTGLTGDLSSGESGTGSKYSGVVDGFTANKDYYAQIVITTAGYEAKSEIAKFTTQATGDTSLNFSDGSGFAGGWTGFSTANAGAWQSVPEPTSGLLMLLGIAGLALKRKRA